MPLYTHITIFFVIELRWLATLATATWLRLLRPLSLLLLSLRGHAILFMMSYIYIYYFFLLVHMLSLRHYAVFNGHCHYWYDITHDVILLFCYYVYYYDIIIIDTLLLGLNWLLILIRHWLLRPHNIATPSLLFITLLPHI